MIPQSANIFFSVRKNPPLHALYMQLHRQGFIIDILLVLGLETMYWVWDRSVLRCSPENVYTEATMADKQKTFCTIFMKQYLGNANFILEVNTPYGTTSLVVDIRANKMMS